MLYIQYTLHIVIRFLVSGMYSTELRCFSQDTSLQRWCVIEGQVIDLDQLSALRHPGGEAVLKLAEGRDATMLYRSTHALAPGRSKALGTGDEAKKDVMASWLKRCSAGKLAPRRSES